MRTLHEPTMNRQSNQIKYYVVPRNYAKSYNAYFAPEKKPLSPGMTSCFEISLTYSVC